jgi:hypothetical protein
MLMVDVMNVCASGILCESCFLSRFIHNPILFRATISDRVVRREAQVHYSDIYFSFPVTGIGQKQFQTESFYKSPVTRNSLLFLQLYSRSLEIVHLEKRDALAPPITIQSTVLQTTALEVMPLISEEVRVHS